MYTGGDNVFVTIDAKRSESGPMQHIIYDRHLPPNHLPGIHWYHPHHHGSSTLQAFSANGIIIVEDDPAWLPDAQGCRQLRGALAAAKEVILHLTLFTFATTPGLPPVSSSTAENEVLFSNQTLADAYHHDANIQSASFISDPRNPLCCGDEAAASKQGLLLTGPNNNSNIALLNGAWAPTIPVTSGVHQRWRIVNTGYKK